MRYFILVILVAATQASPLLFNTNAGGVSIDGADVNRMQSIAKDLVTLVALGQSALEKGGNVGLSADYTQLKAIQSYGNQLKSFLNVASLILSGDLKDTSALARANIKGFDIQTVLSMGTYLTDIVQVVQQFVTEFGQAQANPDMKTADLVIVRLLALDDAKIKKIMDIFNPVKIYSNAALSVLKDRVASSLSAAEVAEYKRLLAVGYPLSTLAGLTRDVMETALRTKANYDPKSLRIAVDKLIAFFEDSLFELLDLIIPIASLIQLVPSIILNLVQNVAGGSVNQLTNFVPFGK